jgi:hypothetical protein
MTNASRNLPAPRPPARIWLCIDHRGGESVHSTRRSAEAVASLLLAGGTVHEYRRAARIERAGRKR